MSQTDQATESVEQDAAEQEGSPEAAPKGKAKGGRKEASEPTPPPADLPQRVEAALLSTDRAMSAAKLSDLLDGVGAKAINDAVAQLNEVYEQTGRSFRIEQVAGGWQVLTLPTYAEVLEAMHRTKVQARVTPAALETLAIIAYKQPILRVDIEAIRGVACGETIRSLMEMHLVKIVGRAEKLGRPMLYGTTKYFLEVFGLAGLKDLPKVEELRPKDEGKSSE